MNENVIVKEYEFNNLLIQKIDSLIDSSIRDCHDKYSHTFDHICEYDLNFTNITNNETVNFTLSHKSMGLYELNKKLTVARGNAYIFIQIKNFEIKIYSNLSNINICYYLTFLIPIMQRQLFRKLPQKHDYIQTHCNNRRNPFHFACHQCFLYYNPQSDMV